MSGVETVSEDRCSGGVGSLEWYPGGSRTTFCGGASDRRDGLLGRGVVIRCLVYVSKEKCWEIPLLLTIESSKPCSMVLMNQSTEEKMVCLLKTKKGTK